MKKLGMKFGTKIQHRFMIIIVVAGLILAAIAFLKPDQAEAGVIVQIGSRSASWDVRVRLPRLVPGRLVWVPGHYEMTIFRKNCRRVHPGHGVKSGQAGFRRTGPGHARVAGRRHGVRPHDHYRKIWVPGHWVRS